MEIRNRLIRKVIESAAGMLVLGCGADGEVSPSETPTREAADSASRPETADSTSRLEARARREREVEAYHHQRSDGWVIVDTRHSPSGQIIDYVLGETLYPGEPDAPFAPPPYEPPAAREIEGPDGALVKPGATEIEADPMLWPPPGTVPVLREGFAHYLEQGDPYRDLADYIARREPLSELEADVYAQRPFDLDGQELAGTLELWASGAPEAPAELSLLRLSQHCLSGDAVEDAVQSGLLASPELFGDDRLHLFAYYTRQGKGSDADYSEGWNLQTRGFVQYAGATSFPGAALDSSTFGAPGGDRYECVVKIHRAADGNWWVYACNNWLGYYPSQLSTTVAPDRRIHFSQMAAAACDLHVVGLERPAGASAVGGPDAAPGSGRAVYVRQLEYRPSTAAPLPAAIPLPDGPITGRGGDEPFAVSRRRDGGAAFGDYFLLHSQ